MFNRRELMRSAALLPTAVVAGGATGAIATCSSPGGIQIDPAILVEINKAVASGCNFIPAITTVIAVVNALFPAVNGATSIAESVITQIAGTLCKNAPMSGKLGAPLVVGDSQIPVHGWVVADGKLVYV
jgi:hypothetical protein